MRPLRVTLQTGLLVAAVALPTVVPAQGPPAAVVPNLPVVQCLPTPDNRPNRHVREGDTLPKWQALRPELAPEPAYDALEVPQLYNLVAPAVHVVVAAKSFAEFQRGRINAAMGSAVAITPYVLVSNAHIVSQHPAAAVKIGDRFYPVELAAVDKCFDRAILVVRDAPPLTPVPGVRPYAELQVGEAAYTIGTPRGLEKSLGKGIISGLRNLGSVRMVQTTAEISPGSSGGGLFDAAGNLIGITTGKVEKKHTQALNFAVGIDEFFQTE